MKNNNHNTLPEDVDVQQMFDDISADYDKLNHILTLGVDKTWRKKLIACIQPLINKEVLDIATGTGDLSFDILRHLPLHITGIDISKNMVELCSKKIMAMNAQEKFHCIQADSQNMPFEDHSFDIACISFGIRNFADSEKALQEIRRVVRPGGSFIVLEFFRSRLYTKNRLFRFYMKHIIPFIGKIVSGHPWAYHYLYNSIVKYYSPEEFKNLLSKNGFIQIRSRKLFAGMAYIVYAVRE